MSSGIYKIINLVNNKSYIGSAVNLKRRQQEHFQRLLTNTHHNQHLQRAYDKYGKDQFKFEILLECPINEMISTEQRFLDTFEPEYNICRIAGSALGRKMTEEHKNKISIANAGKKRSLECVEKMRFRMKGVPHSPEHIAKRMLKLRGRKKTKEQNIKQSINSYRNKPVYKICPNTNVVLDEFRSISEAARIMNVNSSDIGCCTSGRCKTIKGFIWKLKEQYHANK